VKKDPFHSAFSRQLLQKFHGNRSTIPLKFAKISPRSHTFSLRSQLSKQALKIGQRRLPIIWFGWVSRNRIQTEGFGSNEPAAYGDSPDDYAKNRRVVIEMKD